jgi:hypothetical protein
MYSNCFRDAGERCATPVANRSKLSPERGCYCHDCFIYPLNVVVIAMTVLFIRYKYAVRKNARTALT